LRRVRETLNAHHRELHERLGVLDISPFEAMSRAIGLAAEPEADCEIPHVMEWSAQQLGDAHEHLQTLDRRLIVLVSQVNIRGARSVCNRSGLREAAHQ